MTKIPTVEETSRHFCNGIALQLTPSNAVMEAIRLLNKELPKALTADRTALLTELRDSELLEEVKVPEYNGDESYHGECNGHNILARAIKAHINNLINPTSV